MTLDTFLLTSQRISNRLTLLALNKHIISTTIHTKLQIIVGLTEWVPGMMSSIKSSENVDNIHTFIRKGEYLSAYDMASKLLEQAPDNTDYQYLSILALARSGALKHAEKLYYNTSLPDSQNEDYLALGARLAKDKALHDKTDTRTTLLACAASKYEAIYEDTGGDYPAVNAATLYYLAGNQQKARLFASSVIDICSGQSELSGLGEYYRLATLAEAYLVLGQTSEVRGILENAVGYADDDWSSISGTRKQLALLLSDNDASSILAPLVSPSVIHFCGHMISPSEDSGRFPSKYESVVQNAIDKELDRLNVGFGYGSLANGADILFAESLLRRGSAVHIIMPFDINEFVEISVKPAGDEWVKRFEACITQASSITYATDDSYLNDNALFHYATRLAMGLAIQKAQHVSAHIEQLAVWDGKITAGPAGTGADIAFWQSKGYPATLIHSLSGDKLETPPDNPSEDFNPGEKERHPFAMLFGDIKGFSKLKDAELPPFVEHVLGTISKVLTRYDDDIRFRNTWGDGVFIVMNDTTRAAKCATELQAALSEIDFERVGLPGQMTIRIGGHFGPVYEIQDPILGRNNYFGSHVSRAARIEPITPPGEVYVTRQFAAELAIEQRCEHLTEYVGIMPAAKSYGELPMYVLR